MQNLREFKLPTNFRGRNAFFVQFWWLIQGTLFGLSLQFMYGWRRHLLRMFGAKVGKNVLIRPSVRVAYPWKVKIGDFSWIGDDVVLYSLGEISIGANTVISQRSYLCAGTHDYTKDDFPISSPQILIGEQVWIGTDVYIAPGITVGDGAVVGARSSVFKEMPPRMVCLGNPCKPIKPREKV